MLNAPGFWLPEPVPSVVRNARVRCACTWGSAKAVALFLQRRSGRLRPRVPGAEHEDQLHELREQPGRSLMFLQVIAQGEP